MIFELVIRCATKINKSKFPFLIRELRIVVIVKDKVKLDWLPSDSEISLEKGVDEEGADFMYSHEFNKRMRELHATCYIRSSGSYDL